MRSDFTLSSFFPSITIDQILDIEFSLAIHAHITNIEDRDFYEVLSLKERLDNYIQKRNESMSGSKSNVNLMDMLGKNK